MQDDKDTHFTNHRGRSPSSRKIQNLQYSTPTKSFEYALLLHANKQQSAITTWNQNILKSLNNPIKISLPDKSSTGPIFCKKSITESSTSREAKDKLKTPRVKCALSLVSPCLDGEKQQPKNANLNKTSFSFGTHQTRESIRERKKMVIKKIKKDQAYGIQSSNLEQCGLNPNHPSTNVSRDRKRSLKPSQADSKYIHTHSQIRQNNSNLKYQISLKISKIVPDKQVNYFRSSRTKRHNRTVSEQSKMVEQENQIKRLDEFKRLQFLINQEKIQKNIEKIG